MHIKKIGAAVLVGAVALVATAPAVHAWGEPLQIDAGFHFNVQHGGYRCNLGPWYAYFPYEAHFQSPAPVGPFPHWPAPPPANTGTRTAPTSARPAPALQPVGYYGAPSYWYGY